MSRPVSAFSLIDIFHVFIVLVFCFGVAGQEKFSSCVFLWLHQEKIRRKQLLQEEDKGCESG